MKRKKEDEEGEERKNRGLEEKGKKAAEVPKILFVHTTYMDN